MSGSNGWYAVDLDGTLAVYDGWKGIDHIGEPVPAMVAWVKQMLAEGKDVRIFTARVCTDGARAEWEANLARTVIQQWCLEHIGRVLLVTNVKDFGMISLYDDRCVQVEANTGELVAYTTPPCPLCGVGAIACRTNVKTGEKVLCCFECGAVFDARPKDA